MTTNAQFSETDKQFQGACQEAGIPTTARQAGKFQRQKGLAFKVLTKKVKVLKDSNSNFLKIAKQL